jgi:O-antigen ligase/Tfp pilus assembly protein PilF
MAAVLILLDRNYRPPFNKLTYILFIFLVCMLLSNFTGGHFSQSFWSNYSRMEGTISFIYFLVLFLLTSTSFNTEKKWNFFFLGHVVISIGVTALALAQKNKLIHAVDFNRVDGPFGNSSYLAIFASYCVFICLYLVNKTQSKKIKILSYLGLFSNLICIYLSQTRSSTLAVIVSLVFWFLYLSKNKIKTLVFILGASLFCVLGVTILRFQSARSTNLWQRISQISMQDESIQARIQIWKYCLRAISEKPFLGWGQENFSYLTSFYEPQMWSAPWVDRAHNFILENLVSLGFLGTGVFLAILTLFNLNIYKSKTLSSQHKAFLFGFMICWFVNNLFSIEFFSSTYLFFIVLAFGQFLQSKTQIEEKPFIVHSNYRKLVAFILFIIFAVVLNYEFVVKSFLINQKMRELTKPEVVLKIESQKPYVIGLDELLKESPYLGESEIRQFIAQNAVFMLSQNEIQKKYYDFTDYMYRTADNAIQSELLVDPDNLIFKFNAAVFYSQFKNLQQAEILFQQLLQKIPQNQSILISYGNLKLMQGHLVEGLSLYEKAYNLDQNYASAKMYLSLGLVYNKRFDEAKKLIDELLRDQRDEVLDERLIQSLIATNQAKMAGQLIQVRNELIEKRKN